MLGVFGSLQPAVSCAFIEFGYEYGQRVVWKKRRFTVKPGLCFIWAILESFTKVLGKPGRKAAGSLLGGGRGRKETGIDEYTAQLALVLPSSSSKPACMEPAKRNSHAHRYTQISPFVQK